MEVQYKRALVDMVMRQLGFSMDYFALPEGETVIIKMQGKRKHRYSIDVKVPISEDDGTPVALGVDKKRFDDAVKNIQAAALQISECYQIVNYTKDVLPFSPVVRHARYFSTRDQADEFMKAVTTEPGLPAPACKAFKTITEQGTTYALNEIQIESCM